MFWQDKKSLYWSTFFHVKYENNSAAKIHKTLEIYI